MRARSPFILILVAVIVATALIPGCRVPDRLVPIQSSTSSTSTAFPFDPTISSPMDPERNDKPGPSLEIMKRALRSAGDNPIAAQFARVMEIDLWEDYGENADPSKNRFRRKTTTKAARRTERKRKKAARRSNR